MNFRVESWKNREQPNTELLRAISKWNAASIPYQQLSPDPIF
jgi:hypothetical protein